MVCRKN